MAKNITAATTLVATLGGLLACSSGSDSTDNQVPAVAEGNIEPQAATTPREIWVKNVDACPPSETDNADVGSGCAASCWAKGYQGGSYTEYLSCVDNVAKWRCNCLLPWVEPQ